MEAGQSPSFPLKPIGVASLVAVIFFDVAGTPAGSEDAVVAAGNRACSQVIAITTLTSATGPLYALLGFLILPFFWSIPEALITAELATAYPEDAGFVLWVTEAFGEFAG